ncbi:MAG: hypothetical protein P8Y42_18865 [Exilibacterium sp.]
MSLAAKIEMFRDTGQVKAHVDSTVARLKEHNAYLASLLSGDSP